MAKARKLKLKKDKLNVNEKDKNLSFDQAHDELSEQRDEPVKIKNFIESSLVNESIDIDCVPRLERGTNNGNSTEFDAYLAAIAKEVADIGILEKAIKKVIEESRKNDSWDLPE